MPISVPPYMPIAPRHQSNFDIAGSIGGLGDALIGGLEYGQQRKSDKATRSAFQEPVYNPDGTMNFGAMAGKIMQGGGDIDTAMALTRLAETQVQNQYLRGRPQFMSGPGGGIFTEPTVAGEEPREVVPGKRERPIVINDTAYDPDTMEPIVTAPAEVKAPASKSPTIDAMRNKQLLSVVTPELATIESTFAELSKPENQVGALLPGGASNYATSAGYQQGKNALRTIIASYLYSMSGATANPGEVETQTDVLMPRMGEANTSVADKLKRIRVMVDSIKTRSGDNAAAEGEIPPDEQIASPEGQLQVGEEIENPQTGQRLRFLGGDPSDLNNYEPVQ